MSGKTAPFPVTPELTAIAIAYRNPDASLIADDVMPRVRPVSTREFRYTVFDLSHFDRPNTYVGRRGVPNEVSMGAMEETAAIEDYGLDEKIPQDDIDQADRMNRDLSGEAVEYIMNLVKLDREVRVANLVQDTANYGTGCSSTLSGENQWSDPASTPLTALLEALEKPFMRPNTMVMSQGVWSKLRVHPQIVKSVYPLSGEGVVTRQQVADLLEIQTILIGSSRVNNARKGQKTALTPTWGKNCALLYLDRAASSQRGITWGMTVPYGTAVGGSKPDGNIGLRGGLVVRAGESLKELVTAKDAGYLFKDCVA